MRRLGFVLVLLVMTIGPVLALLKWGFYRWGDLNLWSPADVRVLLAALTVIGWLAWAVLLASFVVELVAYVTAGRLHLRLPGLALPQMWAATLVALIFASGTVTATTSVDPVTAASSYSLIQPDSAGDLSTSSTQIETAQTPEHEDETGGVVHTVTSGDDLWSIAHRYYGTGEQWRQVWADNAALISNPTADLPEGIALTIKNPVRSYTVQPGDTLWKLAATHVGDPERWPELHRLNRDVIRDPDVIKIGQVIRLPYQEQPGSAEKQGPAQQATTPTTGATPEPTASPRDVSAPVQQDRSHHTHTDGQGVAARTVRNLVGGLSTLAASAVVGGLWMRRRQHGMSRPLGEHTVVPDPMLQRFETALGVRADKDHDASESVTASPREQLLARAMRVLAAYWWQRGISVPGLESITIGTTSLSFDLDESVPECPLGFELKDSTISIDWADVALLDDVAHSVAWPALITLGEDDDGIPIMIDLVNAGVLGVHDADGKLGADALSAMVVELSCAPWADELSVRVVTADPAFVSAVAVADVQCLVDVERGVQAVERQCAERAALLGDESYHAVRHDPDRSDAWAPWIVVFEKQPDAEQVARLEQAIESINVGVAVVLPVGERHAHEAEMRWELTDTNTPRGTWTATGLELAAQTIPSSARVAITELFKHADTAPTTPAPWWHEPQHARAEEDEVKVITLRPARGIPGPQLRLFGPVELEHAAGTAPTRARRQCLEYLGWLLENPGSTATEMSEALFVADGTRRSNLSRLRSWLGETPNGELYLPDAYGGRIMLHPAVSSDWFQFQQILESGVNRAPMERLKEALSLVTGPPLADVVPGSWAWAGPLLTHMTEIVRDTAVVLARWAWRHGDVELAQWACDRGVLVAPEDELLTCERIRIETARGHSEGVRHMIRQLQRNADEAGIDVSPETMKVCREALATRSS